MVLSGGGSLGAVQVAMLQALSRADVAVDMVIGASVGALNGTFFAITRKPRTGRAMRMPDRSTAWRFTAAPSTRCAIRRVGFQCQGE